MYSPLSYKQMADEFEAAFLKTHYQVLVLVLYCVCVSVSVCV